MKTKILFRVDALKNMGMGHLVRCLALADMLKNHFHCVFLTRTTTKQGVNTIKTAGYDYFPLPKDFSMSEEATWIKETCLAGSEIVVLDGYHFDTEYQSIIKSGAGKLVCIDDVHETRFLADVLINHAGGVQKVDYNCSPDTKLCLGLAYVLLRSAFLQAHQSSNEKASRIKNVLVCFGGEDPGNFTMEALKKCEKLPGLESCKVILGAAYQHLERLKVFCKKSPLNITLLHQLSADEMVETMQNCDTAICSPSTVALEFLTIGGNLFLHKTAANQANLLRFFTEQGLAFPMKNIGAVPDFELRNALNQQAKCTDGKSPVRLLKIFRRLENELHCQLRHATLEDMVRYFVWANDSITRQQSFNSDHISVNQHYYWFRKKIKDANSCMYVMEFKGLAAGQIRFEIDGPLATISYSIDPKFRGKGLSSVLLETGIRKLKKENPQIKTIDGFVKTQNQPSIKAFQNLGFKKARQAASQMHFLQNV